MKLHSLLLVLVVTCTARTASAGLDASKDAETFAIAIEKLNATHAKKPGDVLEGALAEELPAKAWKALERVLESDDLTALERCSEATLEDALVKCSKSKKQRAAVKELIP